MPIDLRIAYPDPMSAAIDHVVPLTLGGLPLDPRNTAPAHKGCNEAKEVARRSSVRQAELGVSDRFLGPERYCPVCEVEPPCATLRALTVPYADRPGYQPEWALESTASQQ